MLKAHPLARDIRAFGLIRRVVLVDPRLYINDFEEAAACHRLSPSLGSLTDWNEAVRVRVTYRNTDGVGVRTVRANGVVVGAIPAC